MPLKSNLFRGDARLEAAAVSDPAHILQGAAGEHVGKIQTALIALDRATLARDSRYGPATAQAVLFYKQKRGIINPGYQTQADNIVGKMTMASLDREMVELERRIDADVCHCREFGGGGGQGRLAFAKQAATPAPALPGTPSQQALARLPLARSEVIEARAFIKQGRDQVLSGLPSTEFAKIESRKALVTHFKIEQIPQPIAQIQHLDLLDEIYRTILSVLDRANTIFIDDPSTTDFANAFIGGIAHLSDPVRGKIRFGPAYAGKGTLFQTSVIVHEAAHFSRTGIDHFASELPAPNGSPVNSSKGVVHTKSYAQLDFKEAAGNAYTYAQFALHALKKFDKRIVPFNE